MSNKFNTIIKKYDNYLSETSMAGAGGVFGNAPSMGHGGAVGNSDFYAPGDSRNVFGLDIVGKKKKKKKKANVLMPMQRRKPFSM